MRTVLGLVFVLCFAPALHSAEDAPLDYEFQWAAEKGTVSVCEMLRRLNAAVPSVGDRTDTIDTSTLHFTGIYAAATRRANGVELDKLAGMLRAMPPESSLFAECFSAYTTARIRERVAELGKKPVHLKWKPGAEEMPKQLADAPASFRNAWKLHSTVFAPYQAVVQPPEMAAAPRKKVPALEVDLRRLIGKPEPEAWKRLVSHVWDFPCGTGSEMLYHPRNRALLLSFLADGKWHEAAGAALGQVPSMTSFGSEDRFESVAIDLLTALGLDWEEVMFGSLLPVLARDGASGRLAVTSAFSGCDGWQLLAARGSKRAVRRCLDLIRWTKLAPNSTGEFLAVALGPEPARPNVSSSDNRPIRSVPLPKQSRDEVLSVFAEYLAPANPPKDLVGMLWRVPFHCVKELREPLAALVSHRVHAVAARAHQLLDRESAEPDYGRGQARWL